MECVECVERTCVCVCVCGRGEGHAGGQMCEPDMNCTAMYPQSTRGTVQVLAGRGEERSRERRTGPWPSGLHVPRDAHCLHRGLFSHAREAVLCASALLPMCMYMRCVRGLCAYARRSTYTFSSPYSTSKHAQHHGIRTQRRAFHGWSLHTPPGKHQSAGMLVCWTLSMRVRS